MALKTTISKKTMLLGFFFPLLLSQSGMQTSGTPFYPVAYPLILAGSGVVVSTKMPQKQAGSAAGDKRYSIVYGIDNGKIVSAGHGFFIDNRGFCLTTSALTEGIGTFSIYYASIAGKDSFRSTRIQALDKTSGLALLSCQENPSKLPKKLSFTSTFLSATDPGPHDKLFLYGQPHILQMFTTGAPGELLKNIYVELTDKNLVYNETENTFGLNFDLESSGFIPAALAGAPVYNSQKKVSGIIQFSMTKQGGRLSLIPASRIRSFLKEVQKNPASFVYKPENSEIGAAAYYSAGFFNASLSLSTFHFENLSAQAPVSGLPVYLWKKKQTFASLVNGKVISTEIPRKKINFTVTGDIKDKKGYYQIKINDATESIFPQTESHYIYDMHDSIIGILTLTGGAGIVAEVASIPVMKASETLQSQNIRRTEDIGCIEYSARDLFPPPPTVLSGSDQIAALQKVTQLEPGNIQAALMLALYSYKNTKAKTIDQFGSGLKTPGSSPYDIPAWHALWESYYVDESFKKSFAAVFALAPALGYEYYLALCNQFVGSSTAVPLIVYSGLFPRTQIYTTKNRDKLSRSRFALFLAAGGHLETSLQYLDHPPQEYTTALNALFKLHLTQRFGSESQNTACFNEAAQAYGPAEAFWKFEFSQHFGTQNIGPHKEYKFMDTVGYRNPDQEKITLPREHALVVVENAEVFASPFDEKPLFTLPRETQVKILSFSAPLAVNALVLDEHLWHEKINAKNFIALICIKTQDGRTGWISSDSVVTLWQKSGDTIWGVQPAYCYVYKLTFRPDNFYVIDMARIIKSCGDSIRSVNLVYARYDHYNTFAQFFYPAEMSLAGTLLRLKGYKGLAQDGLAGSGTLVLEYGIYADLSTYDFSIAADKIEPVNKNLLIDTY